MEHYNRIVRDLLEVEPLTVNVLPPPYRPDLEVPAKITITYNKLLRSTRMRNRTAALTYAFYLGQLLELTLSPAHRTLCASQLTGYYARVCKRTFCIFEASGIEQIYRTKEITLRTIDRLPSKRYKELIS